MGLKRQGDYEKLRKRYKELKKKGYKQSGLWNKLSLEFPGWTAATIQQICSKLGAYKEK